MKDQRSRAPASVDNIYRLDGRVPVGKAIPFGLQHVLAMFVANVTPVMLIASVAVYNGQAFTAIDTALLIQAAMLVAGIGTLTYEDFKDLPKMHEFLPSDNYPVRIEAGQVFAVEYLLSDGSTEWRYYRSDGTVQDGQLITMRIKME